MELIIHQKFSEVLWIVHTLREYDVQKFLKEIWPLSFPNWPGAKWYFCRITEYDTAAIIDLSPHFSSGIGVSKVHADWNTSDVYT